MLLVLILVLLCVQSHALLHSVFLPKSAQLQHREPALRSQSCCCSMALKTFTPQELQIKRFIGELGFMEVRCSIVFHDCKKVNPCVLSVFALTAHARIR
jgi:hypothetical protein